MTYPDPNLDWVALLEFQGAGPEKYHMHASAHNMACQKYVVAAKQAKTSGNAERAKLLRKIGNKHKAAAEALLAIANHHTDALYGIQLKKKAELMPKKPVKESLEDIVLEDQELELEDIAEGDKAMKEFEKKAEGEDCDEDEDEIKEDTRVQDLIMFVFEEKALDFQRLVFEIIADRIADELEMLQQTIAEGVAADSDGSDEDDEEDSKQSPEIQGESVEEIDEVSFSKLGRYIDKADDETTSGKKDRSKGIRMAHRKKYAGLGMGFRKPKVVSSNEEYTYAVKETGPIGKKIVPPMGQEHVSEPAGKKFPTGRQAGDLAMKKLGQKNKSQKGSTKASGNDKRDNEAAD